MFCWPKDVLLRCVVRLHGLLHSERGQTLGEYALIVSLVGVGITIIALIAFRTQLVAGWDAMSNCLNGNC